MFSVLNDVMLTIQIMTLKIVTNIINLSHGFPHFAFVFWLVTHIAMRLVLPSLSSRQCTLNPAQRAVFWAGCPFLLFPFLSISLLLSPVRGISWPDSGAGWLRAENDNNYSYI